MGRTKIEPEDPAGWQYYLTNWMATYNLTNADLARATGIGESQISRWLHGTTTPNIEGCRKVAKALRRPMIELVVAAGHMSAEEARVSIVQKPLPLPADAQRLVRAQKLANDSNTPPAVRERLRVLLDLVDEIAGGVS